MTITAGGRILLSKRKIDKFLYSLYFFILIFAPPLIPYPHLFLTIFSFLALLTTYRKTAWDVFCRSGIYKWDWVMVLLGVYTVCVPLPVSVVCNDIVNASHYMSVINRYGVLTVAVSVCVTYLLCKSKQNGYDYKFLLECVINAGLIEGVCSILAFLFPSVKTFFIFFMQQFSESTLYSNTWYITVRSYGFASTLVDVFGLGIGIIAGICFFYGVTNNKIYILESVVIAVATLLNSRTGLIIYAMAILCTMLVVIETKNIKKIVTIFFALGILAFLGMKVLEIMSTNEYTASWFQSGIDSINNFISGNKSMGNNDAMRLLLEKQSWDLPDFPRIIIGTGHSLYAAEGYSHSDVGYINELWLFGITGCIFLYGNIIRLCSKLHRSKNFIFKFLGLFLVMAYFFFNIKGAALGYNPGAVAMFICVFIGLYSMRVNNNQ